jgi:hypothetical protein
LAQWESTCTMNILQMVVRRGGAIVRRNFGKIFHDKPDKLKKNH